MKKIRPFVILFLLFLGNLAMGIGDVPAQEKPSSGELLSKAWAAHGRHDTQETFKYTQQLIDLYKEEANTEEASLSALPKSQDEINKTAVLSDVASAYFIQAESYMRQDKLEDAKKIFTLIIEKYPYAQAWDQRGWYWKVSEKAAQSIKKIETGSIELEREKKISQFPSKVVLHEPGVDVIDYSRYGKFENVGTDTYQYIIVDQEGLSAAAGEGIYPNTTSIKWDPEYKKALAQKRLEGSYWDYVQSPDLEAAFLKWAAATEPRGVRLFYTAFILEKSGLIKQAIKCYYAIVVHFPAAYGWTYWHTPWYVGPAAIAKIQYLLRHNPTIGLKLVDADIRIQNGYDNDVSNDIAIVNPGHFVKVSFWDKIKPRHNVDPLSLKRRIGKGKVHLVQYTSGDWQLIVDNKPYIIKGVTYTPTKVGESPDDGTLTNWMEDDFNRNGKIDGPYDTFVDKNRNNIQDKNEPIVGDFHLMKEMGVNTIRVYHQPFKVNKQLMQELYTKYGIRVIMGDFLGKYTFGSGAPWNPGTDYNNPEHKKNMLKSVTDMVMEFKDEPYILFWLLGNENVYGYACNADKDPQAFFSFANEVALAIKAIDPEHPVAICSGDTLFLEVFGKYAPDIDIFGTNAYRGNYGFGYLWKQVNEEAGKPAFITEYGCPAYAEGKTVLEAETLQAESQRGAWEDIASNIAFKDGTGNAIGGVIFEWLDEWWKAYEPYIHDTKGLFTGPFPDGYMHEEWLGLCGQGNGKASPFLRQLRKSYYEYKRMWR